jgi:hypothetical protein
MPKNIKITKPSKVKQKSYTRSLTQTWFDRKAWFTGCGSKIAPVCFPCLLFKSSSSDSVWTKTGVTDLKHLSERLKKHERSINHMNKCVQLAIGRISIAAQLDEGHRIGVRRHNEEVAKN